MINWKLLYDKFGRLNAAKKFEDLALDYVCDVYNEYTWKPTQRTRDGNRDFHNLVTLNLIRSGSEHTRAFLKP